MVGRIVAAIARWFRRGPKIITHTYSEDVVSEPRLGEDVPEDHDVESFFDRFGPF